LINILRHLLVVFYVGAGSYHFINPGFYLALIPDYLPFPEIINDVSGILEIILGIGVATKRFRKISVIGIIILLILFIPSHLYFIQTGSCVDDGLCVSPWVAWIRLVIIHPLLMYWAWLVKSKN
jgi:uncharacterized membrane protein